MYTGGYKCRITTIPTRFAHVISILRYCHYFASLKVLCHEQMNKYHIISYSFTCTRCMDRDATIGIKSESEFGISQRLITISFMF